MYNKKIKDDNFCVFNFGGIIVVKKKKRLGDILVEAGFISQEELDEALVLQKEKDKRLGEILKEMDIVTEQDVVEALEFQLGIPQVDLKKFIIDSEIVNLISQELAKKHRAIPIRKEDGALTVAMADPMDIMAIDDIRINTGYEVNPVIATEDEIEYAIDQYFGTSSEMQDLMENIGRKNQGVNAQSSQDIDKLKQMVEDAPVVKLVNGIITDGIKLRASDIHIEPQQEEVWVRYRVDGILHQEMKIPKHTHAALVSRIKIMSDMDIAERRVPQDGRIKMTMEDDKEIDLRISTLPTVKGEKVVIRILDKSNLMLDLDSLGFLPQHKDSFDKFINQSHGMVLITGPTGSGKTTTLYSGLSSLDNDINNIVTVEDPVEYRLGGINQVQTNPKAGLTFSAALRSILRQDPDIVMIGEIRDKETAEIAIHAALTGHLVLSTLHTNDAAGALGRLIDMGVEPFLVASSVIGVVAQRLVRTICPNCKSEGRSIMTNEQLSKYVDGAKSFQVYSGEGCRQCNDTGYQGRTAIHEMIDLDNDLKRMVVNEASSADLKEKAVSKGMVTLEESGITKAREGLTTMEEVMRVTTVHI